MTQTNTTDDRTRNKIVHALLLMILFPYISSNDVTDENTPPLITDGEGTHIIVITTTTQAWHYLLS
jgi:hypothetical protein